VRGSMRIYIFDSLLPLSTQPCTPNISTIPLQAQARLSAHPPLTTLSTNACSNSPHHRLSRISNPCQRHGLQNQLVRSRYPIPTRGSLPRKTKSKDEKYGITRWKNLCSIHSNCKLFVSYSIKLSDYILHRSTVGAPNRRTIYIASLEAHVDRLHSQLLE
jgi:hypothetical protein